MADNKTQKPMSQPNNPDPYDMNVKLEIHSKADARNFIEIRKNKKMLCCGARKKHGPGFCRSIAGAGTDHIGYGRCKFCGGATTGPKTAAGKAITSQNSRKHGFYSKVLRGQEQETYEDLLEKKSVTLENEIYMLKAKILTYLDKWQVKIDEGGDKDARQFITSGLDQERTYYTASTADDRVLQRALETLRRLVDSHSKLVGGDSEGLLDSINAELRAATQGEVTVAWKSRPAQQRKGKE